MTVAFNYLDPPVKREELGFGRIGVPRNTALRMRDIIRKSGQNEYVRKWAEKIVEDVEDRDEFGEVNAIFNFLQQNTRYAHDIRGTEYIQTPPYVLKHIEIGDRPSLDCDDYVVTGLSLARSMGYKTAIRLAGFGPKNGRFTHVFGLANIHGRWTPFDPVRKDKELGWQAPQIKRRLDIEV